MYECMTLILVEKYTPKSVITDFLLHYPKTRIGTFEKRQFSLPLSKELE